MRGAENWGALQIASNFMLSGLLLLESGLGKYVFCVAANLVEWRKWIGLLRRCDAHADGMSEALTSEGVCKRELGC